MRFRRWRKQKGLSQQEAAQLLGFTQPTISRIEANESAVSIEAALKIEAKTGVKLGPIASATRREIALIRRVHPAGMAA